MTTMKSLADLADSAAARYPAVRMWPDRLRCWRGQDDLAHPVHSVCRAMRACHSHLPQNGYIHKSAVSPLGCVNRASGRRIWPRIWRKCSTSLHGPSKYSRDMLQPPHGPLTKPIVHAHASPLPTCPILYHSHMVLRRLSPWQRRAW